MGLKQFIKKYKIGMISGVVFSFLIITFKLFAGVTILQILFAPFYVAAVMIALGIFGITLLSILEAPVLPGMILGILGLMVAALGGALYQYLVNRFLLKK